MDLDSIINIVLRSVTVYLFVLIFIRIFGKKELAQLSVIDLVFILLISNSVQNAMVGSNTSLLGGLVAAIALFSVNFIFKKVLYRHPKIGELIQGKAIPLIYDGKIQYDHLQKTEITITELDAAIREHGVADAAHVFLAMLEVDGNISIVSNDITQRTNHHLKNKRRSKISLFKK